MRSQFLAVLIPKQCLETAGEHWDESIRWFQKLATLFHSPWSTSLEIGADLWATARPGLSASSFLEFWSEKTPSENPRQFRIAPLILTSFCSDSFLRCALPLEAPECRKMVSLWSSSRTHENTKQNVAANFRRSSSRCRVARFSKFSSKSRCSIDLTINSTQKICPLNSANKSRKRCFLSLDSNFFYFCFADYLIFLIIFSCFFFLIFFWKFPQLPGNWIPWKEKSAATCFCVGSACKKENVQVQCSTETAQRPKNKLSPALFCPTHFFIHRENQKSILIKRIKNIFRGRKDWDHLRVNTWRPWLRLSQKSCRMKAWYVTKKFSIETYPQKPLCEAPGPVEKGGPSESFENRNLLITFPKVIRLSPNFYCRLGPRIALYFLDFRSQRPLYLEKINENLLKNWSFYSMRTKN